MAYTNPWDDTVPAGTVPANTIDEEIRKVRLDIHDRMNDKFVEDWTADPLVIKGVAGGPKTGKKLVIPFVCLTPSTVHGQYDDGDLTTDHAMYYGLVLPPGITITAIELLAHTPLALTWQLKKFSFDVNATTKTVVGSKLAGVVFVPTISTLDLSGTPETTDENTVYYIRIPDNAGPPIVYGIRITYNTPGVEVTI